MEEKNNQLSNKKIKFSTGYIFVAILGQIGAEAKREYTFDR